MRGCWGPAYGRAHYLKQFLLFVLFLGGLEVQARSHFKPRRHYDCEFTLRSVREHFPPPGPIVERRPNEIPQLRVGTYNIYSVFKNPFAKLGKSIEQVREMFRILNEEDADILFLQEVESRAFLERANHDLLGNRYHVHLIEGSDPIHVAVLIKKDLPFDFVIRSGMGARWRDPQGGQSEELFTRDFPIVQVFTKNESENGNSPLMVLMGTHFKSKRDRDRDPESKRLAAAQFNAAKNEIRSYLSRYCQELPIFLAGDFNRDIRHDREPQIFMDLMRDTFDLAKKSVPPDARVTQTFHPLNGKRVLNQLDAILASSAVSDLVMSAWIPRYQDRHGNELPLPQTFRQRSQNPSDHYPVFIDLDFAEMLKRFEANRELCREEKKAA